MRAEGRPAAAVVDPRHPVLTCTLVSFSTAQRRPEGHADPGSERCRPLCAQPRAADAQIEQFRSIPRQQATPSPPRRPLQRANPRPPSPPTWRRTKINEDLPVARRGRRHFRRSPSTRRAQKMPPTRSATCVTTCTSPPGDPS
jgi:hypothetical protein